MAHVMLIIFFLMSIGSMLHVDLRNDHVALSNLRVKGHLIEHQACHLSRLFLANQLQ